MTNTAQSYKKMASTDMLDDICFSLDQISARIRR